MKIGIISDTHGMLRPEVIAALEGCEAILHGGDINRQEIIDRLEEIAPVYIVRGNNDREWAEHIPYFLDFELSGRHICMAHRKKDLPGDLGVYDLAVYGHSHKYEEIRAGNTLLLNPGSCGPRRFHQAVTMALAEIREDKIIINRIDLPQHQSASLPGSAAADLRKQILIIIRDTQRGRSPAEIAGKHGYDPRMTEQIVRLYLTHPGVDADGIMTKMGY